ncbi:hypothetical protein ACFUTV_14670 [Streptomyces sp. NPDC057298]|uniref:hypothetical protein n=1 Tax=Streptomyces sp. NPDC057298 TaxID=3346091 RepID=UPI0036398CC9
MLILSSAQSQKLEKWADKILAEAGEQEWDDWPPSWESREESDFDRITVAPAGGFPPVFSALVANLPDYDPGRRQREIRDLMEECPGAVPADTEGEALATGIFHATKTAPQREVWEGCRWLGCPEPLYSPENPRRRGKPRKYCESHKKASRARTERLRGRGIQVGKHRNMVYGFHGDEGQNLDGYREVWAPVNVPGA